MQRPRWTQVSSLLTNKPHRKRNLSVTLLALLTGILCSPRLALASTTNNILPNSLTVRNLTTAAAVVALTNVGLAVSWGLGGLFQSLLIAALRCMGQLYLVTGFLLTHFLATQQPSIVLAWILVTGIIAATEAATRVEYTYPNLRRHLITSLLFGSSVTTALTIALRVMGPIRPWFSPRTWIPVSGMLYGNTLNAVSLAAATLTTQLATRRNVIELRLARGASSSEAVAPSVREALVRALTPTLNALSVAGIVHVPGMMTGQILAGQAPYQAAAYQVVIFFLIASMASLTTQTFTKLMLRDIITGERLRYESLRAVAPRNEKTGPGEKILAVVRKFNRNYIHPSAINGGMMNRKEPIMHTIQSVADNDSQEEEPVFRIDRVPVDRANIELSMDVFPGDRVALSGPSGAGKSQVLRTIVGFEALDTNRVSLKGSSAADMGLPEWRMRVAFIPQGIPNLEGTPREFIDQVHKYKSQRRNFGNDPSQYCRQWGLSTSILDQTWMTLSGGEAQRVMLAITLSLNPEILLLDESLSALDEATTRRVEETIMALDIPVVMVSHSTTQIRRVCNREIEVNIPRQFSSGPTPL